MNANDCGLPTLDYSGSTYGITTSGRLLKSPLYGSNGRSYMPDTDCTYTLRNHPSYPAPAYFLVINFMTSVTFKVPGTYPKCDTDYLEITIGERDPKTFKYCGNSAPFPLYSHEGVIKIRVVAHENSDGGVFQFDALVRERDFGPDCLFHNDRGPNGVIISPTYPRGYPNNTCDERIFVGSQKDIDFYFFDINLKTDSSKGGCSQVGTQQDHVEVRGTPYVTTSFEDATPIGQVKCGNVSGIYTMNQVEFDYVYIRFHGNTMVSGYRGMYLAYSIYDAPKPPPPKEGNPALVWTGVICGVLILIIVLWVFIIKAMNSKKKQQKSVAPASETNEDAMDGYIPNMPPSRRQNQGAPPPTEIHGVPVEEPDYNPAELFAAYKHVALPSEDGATDKELTDTLFPGQVQPGNNLTAGLSPGYLATDYERQTSGLMNT